MSRRVAPTGLRALILTAALLLPLASCSKVSEQHTPGKWEGDPSRAAPPEPDPRALGRPVFRFLNETFPRGTAFLLDWKGRTFLISCYHVFGGNHKAATLVRQQEVLARAGAEKLPPGRSGTFRDDCDARGEVTALPVTEALSGRSFRLAPEPPRLGQPAWLYSMTWEDEVDRRLSGNSPFAPPSFTPYLTGGTVTRSSNFALELEYRGLPALEMSSGAPLLDSNGAVIGVNAGFCMRGGKITGLAAPHQAIIKALKIYD